MRMLLSPYLVFHMPATVFRISNQPPTQLSTTNSTLHSSFYNSSHMDSSSLLILFCLILRITSSNSVSIPVTKDPTTLQYLAQIKLGTQQISTNFVLDLGGTFLWDVSSSGKPIQSSSIHCSLPNVNKDCSIDSENRITQLAGKGYLVEEILTVDHTILPLLVSSAPTLLLSGLASNAKGVLGLGRTRLSLPSQLAAVSHHQHKFAMCLSSSSSDGVIVSGKANILDSLTYTPFTHRNDDYYITVKSVKINGRRLSVDKYDVKISTIVPYTTMESRVYEVFTKAYALAAETMNMTRVEPVSPFGLCFRSDRVGVPEIELMLQSEMVKWKISGRNSMVRMSDEVICLGFLDGGVGLDRSIVIGGFQLEDNLLEFDLGRNMIGFSSSLLSRGTSCSQLGLDYMSSQVF